MKLGAINHIALTVTDMSRSQVFYQELLGFMGYELAENSPSLLIWVNPVNKSVITISPANPDTTNKFHDRYSPGLHHLAFSAESQSDVDRLYQLLKTMQAHILDAPAEYDYMPGYYAVYFLDPDNIKLELTYIPNW